MLRWAREHICPRTEMRCGYAVSGGYLDVLNLEQAAHGCPWNDVTCFVAVSGWRVEVLWRAPAHGAP